MATHDPTSNLLYVNNASNEMALPSEAHCIFLYKKLGLGPFRDLLLKFRYLRRGITQNVLKVPTMALSVNMGTINTFVHIIKKYLLNSFCVTRTMPGFRKILNSFYVTRTMPGFRKTGRIPSSLNLPSSSG